MDCTLAATGAFDPTVTLVVAAALIAAGAVVLWRLRSRAAIGILVAIGALALVIGTPAPSMAAASGSCPTATPTPEPQATLSASPGSLVDVLTVPGDSSAITVTNTSTNPAIDVTAAMRDGLDFSVYSSTCSGTLAPGASCTVTVGMIIGPGNLNDELRVSASNANTVVVLVAISQ